MLHILVLVFIGACIWAGLHALPLFLVGGTGLDDLRRIVLHRAYGSFTFEGDVIPGVRPSLLARLLVLTLSPEDDARRALVVKAMAASEHRSAPLVATVRRLLRVSVGTGRGASASRALVQARWFANPPVGVQFRARSVAWARERAW